MTIPSNTVAVAGLAALAAFGVTCSNANATPFFDNGDLTIWSADTPGATSTSSTQQGTATNNLRKGTPVFTGSYTGAIAFIDPSRGSNTVGGFLATAGGAVAGTENGSGLKSILSNSGYTHASLFDFTFTIPYTITFTVTHDDGFSIWNAANNAELVKGFEAPTAVEDLTFTLAAGTYNLWYSEANGLPADLVMQVPEPASIATLGLGLIGTGMLTRRRRSAAAIG